MTTHHADSTGVIRPVPAPLATQAEMDAGTSIDERAYTPADIKRAISTNAPSLASQAEAEAGSNNTKMMTPLRVSQAIGAQVGGIGNPFPFQTTAQCADATALISQIMTATGLPTSYNANVAFAIKVGNGSHIHFVSRNGSFGDGEDGSYINASGTSATRTQQVAITYPIASGTTILVYSMTLSPSVGA